MKLIYLASIPLIVLPACKGEEQFLERINQVGPGAEVAEIYKVRLAASTFVMKDMGTAEISKQLIAKLIELQSFPEARYCIDHLLSKDQNDPHLYYFKAVCYRNERQYELADAAIQNALRLSGSDAKFISESENIRDEQFRWQRIDSLTAQLSQSPGDNDLLLARSEAFLGLRLFKESEFDAQYVMDMDPENYRSQYLLGLNALLQADYDQAVTVFGRLVENSQKDKTSEMYQQMLSSASSLREATRQIAHNPNEIRPYINAARELSLLGEFQRAHRTIDAALEHHQQHPNLLHARLFLYLQQGDMDQARETARYIESLGYQVDQQLRALLQ